MNKRLYGYARVSTKDQNLDRQLIALRNFGVPKENILIEMQSGKDFNRPIYKSLLKKLNAGDILVIKSIDRLGREYDEIVRQWRYITKKLDADIVVIDLPLLDTRKKDRDLTAHFVADIVLQILSYVAETEREFTRLRQAEGIAAAKARGVKFGRKPLARPNNYDDVYILWAKGAISATEAAERLEVSRPTFMSWARE